MLVLSCRGSSIITQMHLLPALFITSIDFIHIKKKQPKLLIFVLFMSGHQFLFGFEFSPFLLLRKMWKIVEGREWLCLRGSAGLQLTRLNNRFITYMSVHEKGVYFSKTATAFTQKFWMKVKPSNVYFLSVLPCCVCLSGL